MSNAVQNVKRAREVIAAIPEEKLDLHTFFDRGSCGTIACAAGHLALLGEFGLVAHRSNSGDPTEVRFNGLDWIYTGFDAMAQAMGLSASGSYNLFEEPGHSRYDYAIYGQYGDEISDRDLFLYRCDAWLEENAA